MNRSYPKRLTAILMAFSLWAPAVVATAADVPDVGQVSLSNSGKETAQVDFLAGLAALHSFWYEEARLLFRRAQKADPGFALAYWGEALTHHHPIWRSTSATAGREALERIPAEANRRVERVGTAEERALLATARVLFSSEADRDRAWAEALEKEFRKNPGGVEIGAFYALALQGRIGWRQRDTQRGRDLAMQSAAILEALLERAPRHPGLLHYLIHAYDTPEDAYRGVAAARLYAGIAPDAHHAQHMPSHIFLQIGDWDGVVRSNRRAWEASEVWVEARQLPAADKDYHALSWLHYGLLQKGDFEEARRVRKVLRTNAGSHDYRLVKWQARAAVEAREWKNIDLDGASDEARFARGLAAAWTGDLATARELQRELGSSSGEEAEIYARSLEGVLAYLSGRHREAADVLRSAGRLEQESPVPSGPPDLIKPALELEGEILLLLGRCEAARRAFEASLKRMPGRRLSLAGRDEARSCGGAEFTRP